MSERICKDCPLAEVYGDSASVQMPDNQIHVVMGSFIYRACLTRRSPNWKEQIITATDSHCILSDEEYQRALAKKSK